MIDVDHVLESAHKRAIDEGRCSPRLVEALKQIREYATVKEKIALGEYIEDWANEPFDTSSNSSAIVSIPKKHWLEIVEVDPSLFFPSIFKDNQEPSCV